MAKITRDNLREEFEKVKKEIKAFKCSVTYDSACKDKLMPIPTVDGVLRFLTNIRVTKDAYEATAKDLELTDPDIIKFTYCKQEYDVWVKNCKSRIVEIKGREKLMRLEEKEKELKKWLSEEDRFAMAMEKFEND